MDPQPTPQLVFDTLVAYQRSAALATAIELELFTKIASGSATVAQLATACRASERGVRSLCDYLVVDGFLAKSGERYSLAPVAAKFLDRREPTYLGSIAEFLHCEVLRDAFGTLTEAVRRGSTAVGEGGTLAPEHPAWRSFARGMAPVIAPQAELLAQIVGERVQQVGRVLDVSAGHGLFGIACARRWPEARIVFADWPNVLEVALENARKAGVAERVSTRPGDATKIDLGGPYDLVLVPNFLHHFDAEACERFLARAHAATRKEGLLAIVEFLVAPDRVSPPPAARFSLVMLATTPGGNSFTAAEITSLATRAGFRAVETRELEGFGAQAIFARA